MPADDRLYRAVLNALEAGMTREEIETVCRERSARDG